MDSNVIGVVSSPSTNTEITIDILEHAYGQSLVGALVMLEQPMGSGTDRALGVIREIETVNSWHENTSMRGVIRTRGGLPNLSGKGDVRTATVGVTAVYQCSDDEGRRTYRQGTASMASSPVTGAHVAKATDEAVEEMLADVPARAYLGQTYRQPELKLPLSLRDFSGSRGAYHTGIFGMTGSGKTAFATYYLATMLRHRDLGMFICDPQNQFTSERELPFSLKEEAERLGRNVERYNVATDLRLPKSKFLFSELLLKTGKFFGIALRVGPVKYPDAAEQFGNFLDKRTGWDEAESDELLREAFEHFTNPEVAKLIYASSKKDDIAKITDAAGNAMSDPDVFRQLLDKFAPMHSLFRPRNSEGSIRTKLEALIRKAIEKQEGTDRPVVILAMTGEPLNAEVAAINSALTDSVKARILREVVQILNRRAEELFLNHAPLVNAMVVFDEAARYCPSKRSEQDDEVNELADKLARCARETRKVGIGWTFITQSVSDLNPAVWGQLAVRAFGYGIGGSDMDKMRDFVDRKDLEMYRSFADPDSRTHDKEYPFMLVGPVSPISFTGAPVYLSVCTDIELYRAENGRLAEFEPDNSAKSGPTGSPALPSHTEMAAEPKPSGLEKYRSGVEFL
ncbi:MAG: DUF87 domain-containing protein [Acidimicrobiia bacterium]